MGKFSASDVLRLPVPERLQLVEDIWNSIADAPDAIELTEQDKRLIDQSLEAYRKKIPLPVHLGGKFTPASLRARSELSDNHSA